MTKAELVKEISNRVSMSQKDVASVIDVLPEVIKETVANGYKINLVGFLTATKKHVPAKSGKTVLGGVEKPWTTEPKDEVSIKLSKSYKTI
jgi:DNA-binding protein HU-beta